MTDKIGRSKARRIHQFLDKGGGIGLVRRYFRGGYICEMAGWRTVFVGGRAIGAEALSPLAGTESRRASRGSL